MVIKLYINDFTPKFIYKLIVNAMSIRCWN